jgi:hypothetical protein
MSKEELLVTAENYNSIYLNNLSAFCARLSCGSLLELCKAVAIGQVLNGVAIVRPPGHHAEPDEAGGFCLFNNVAIAARYLQKHHHLKKIFILDWLVAVKEERGELRVFLMFTHERTIAHPPLFSPNILIGMSTMEMEHRQHLSTTPM